MATSHTAASRPLSTPALNRAIAKQGGWVVVNRATGAIDAFSTSRRGARDKQRAITGHDTVIRKIDVRVSGVRA